MKQMYKAFRVYKDKAFLFFVTALSISIDCNGQWSSQLQSGAGSYISIHFADNDNGFVTGSRFQFSKTTTGGNRWIAQNNNLGPEELTSVFMTSPLDVYLIIKGVSTGSLDQLFISRDAGVNFTRNRYGVFRTVYFYNLTTGYCVGANGTIIKTENAGQTWNQLNTGTTQLINDIYFPDAQTGFIIGDNGLLRKTANAGTSWQALNSGTASTLSAVYFTSPSTGYCVGANGTALRTLNAGLTWIPMIVGTTISLRDIIFTNPLTGFIIGDFGTILNTTDGGTTWRTEDSGTFENLNTLATAPNGRVWAAGDNGTVLVRNTTVTNIKSNIVNSGVIKVYPNPITDKVNFDFDSDVKGPIEVVISNSTGQVMLKAAFNIIDGKSIKVPVYSLAPGIYVATITTTSGMWNRKLIKTQ